MTSVTGFKGGIIGKGIKRLSPGPRAVDQANDGSEATPLRRATAV